MATLGELKRGAGVGKVLYLDCFSGLSGDMVVSAMLDLGVPLRVIQEAAEVLPLSGYSIRAEREERRSLKVSRFFVDVDEGKQPPRHFEDIREMIEGASLTAGTKKLAVEIFSHVAKAEATAHGTTVEKVHFHEVGAVDSIIDIVGAAAAFDYLGATVICAPVPLGTGFVKTQHGNLPIPAPATLLILEGVPVEGTDVKSELTTPTGAAIVKAVSTSFGAFPPMAPSRVGLGAGSRCHDVRPGILRAVLGDLTDGAGAAKGVDDAGCVVVETNIDDMTGEVAASAMASILEDGALDVWLENIQMKKGRPALKLSVLCKRDDLERIGAAVMRETTTIGLRYFPVGRMEMRRSVAEVDTEFGKIRVKVSFGPLGSANAAPEYEDCARAAQTHGVALKRVMAVAAGAAQKLLDK